MEELCLDRLTNSCYNDETNTKPTKENKMRFDTVFAVFGPDTEDCNGSLVGCTISVFVATEMMEEAPRGSVMVYVDGSPTDSLTYEQFQDKYCEAVK